MDFGNSTNPLFRPGSFSESDVAPTRLNYVNFTGILHIHSLIKKIVISYIIIAESHLTSTLEESVISSPLNQSSSEASQKSVYFSLLCKLVISRIDRIFYINTSIHRS